MIEAFYPTFASLPIKPYGFFLFLSLSIYFIGTYFTSFRKRWISTDLFYTYATWSVIAGLAGGKLLFIAYEETLSVSTLKEFLLSLQHGFSLLGGVGAVFLFLIVFTLYQGIPLLALLDIAVLYAPLAEAIARIGCLTAGCCYGLVGWKGEWAIMYTHPDQLAPLYIPLFPSQLVTSIGCLFVFALLLIVYVSNRLPSGGLTGVYLLLLGILRFSVDFWRGDRGPLTIANQWWLRWSFYQYVALFTVGMGILIFFIAWYYKDRIFQWRITSHSLSKK